MQSSKRALVTAVSESPVTGPAGPSACSCAAVVTTAETVVEGDAVLWVWLGVLFLTIL